MSRITGGTRLAVGAILAVALFGTACNAVGNKPDWSEAVVHGTGIEFVGDKASDPTAITAKLTFSVIDRNQSGTSTSDLNAIEFTSFTITWTDPVPSVAIGAAEGVFYPVGSDGNIIILGAEPPGVAEAPGQLINAHVHFDGKDNLGRHVQWDVDFGTTVGT